MSSKYSEACSTAETFVHLFYDKMDTTKRNQIGKLYMDTASVSWNGNRIDGTENIQKFLNEKLPPTKHELWSLDAQPVLPEAVGGATTVTINVAGSVRYENRRSKPFQHNFMVTAVDSKWKVATEVFRYQEPSTAALNSGT